MAQETGTRDIEQDLALCEKATPGPWQARQIVSTVGPMQMLAANGWEILGMTEDGMPLADWFERKEDAVFTVEARVALPYWLGEVKRLQKALQDAVDGKKARGWKSQKTSRLGDLSQGGRGCIYETAQGDGTYLSRPGARAYRYGSCVVVVGHEKGRWHISISHQNRLPKWEEVRDARYQFVPKEVTMVMVLPRPEQYVNIHPNCLHLWETTDMVPGEWG